LACGPVQGVHSKPPRTPTGFQVTQAICEKRAELDAPFAEGFVTNFNAALEEQFLHISVAERKAVVQPDGVLDVWSWQSGGGMAWRRSRRISLPQPS